ncbi:MAG TPA: DUF2062 domain-containing protein [Verrucomicrobiae bacterium]|nr:DUF2062 domain-containing protein [Verrucomicrobiae bacterium]
MNACIVIPSFNHSATVAAVVEGAQAHGEVIVVDDGSTEPLPPLPGARIVRFEHNRGKGAALRAGFAAAREAGYTHAVTLDADGQHAPDAIPEFLDAARRQPEALLVGVRDFVAAGAPKRRGRANAFSNFWFRAETGIVLGDTQCGFRCYPLDLMSRLRIRSDRYAFEYETLVRAAWCGAPVVAVPVQCSYRPEQVRRSHFRPVVDMCRMSHLNARLVMEAFLVPTTLRRAWSVGERWSPGRVTREFFSEHAHEPARMAGAVGLGLFCGIAPIWGWQMIAAAALAHRLRLNKAIALVASNISIPPVAPFILWGGLEIGHRLFTGEWLELSARAMTRSTIGEHLLHWAVGSVMLAVLAGIVGTALTYAVARLVRR